ncbi:unnamed protein product [Adineta ricciae]|uniref:Guanine nucleotide-binding protein subunit gamma n=1 Tax=Adineta ricciae TaxID=249248 RepID=A0A814JHU2_ADIRI|nr:unnamed protein product [Adineta ricciae]
MYNTHLLYFNKRERSMAGVERLERIVAELRNEAKVQRINVSVACQDLVKYCQDHELKDVLVSGFEHRANEFESKRKLCIMI